MLSKLLLAVCVIGAFSALDGVNARQMTKQQMKARQVEAAKRFQVRNTSSSNHTTGNNITFSNPKASGTLSSHYTQR